MKTRAITGVAAAGLVLALCAPRLGAEILGGGDVHSVVVHPDGTVWAWGADFFGQLGDGHVGARYTTVGPVRVRGLRDVVAIAAGGNHNIALRADGSVWAWGNNSYGELGDGTREMRVLPVRVAGLRHITAVAAGFLHSLALDSDGAVWAWGNDIHGQLGDGRHDGDRLAPVRVTNLPPARAIAAGFFHTIAIDRHGAVWTWGQNTHGQLGDGTHMNRDRPGRLDLAAASAVSGGQFHSLALLADGTVMSWGANIFGQLGYATAAITHGPLTGTAIDGERPAVVPSLPPVVQLAAGEDFSAVLAADHTVWGWGQNLYGELGEGTFENRSTPVRAKVPGEVTAIAAGNAHVIAVRADGDVFAWGFSHYGQLGLGRPERRVATPTQVAAVSLRPRMYGASFLAFGPKDVKGTSPLHHWDGGQVSIRGTATSDYGYALSFASVKAGPGQDLRAFVAEGDVKLGGVTVGVQAANQWVFTQNIVLPGPFLVRWEPPKDGEYSVVFAHYLDPKNRRTDIELDHVGWFRAPAQVAK